MSKDIKVNRAVKHTFFPRVGTSAVELCKILVFSSVENYNMSVSSVHMKYCSVKCSPCYPKIFYQFISISTRLYLRQFHKSLARSYLACRWLNRWRNKNNNRKLFPRINFCTFSINSIILLAFLSIFFSSINRPDTTFPVFPRCPQQ